MAGPLNTAGFWRISVRTSAEAEEPAAALLETLYQAAPSIYTDAETSQSVVTVFVPQKPSGWLAERKAILSGLSGLRQLGLEIGAGKISLERVPREDWSESWKKHFKTIRIGSALMLKPSWSREKARPNQAVVVLDPGLSFGTGQHATTHFCLGEIVRTAQKIPQGIASTPLSMLDIGCGSGILAIAAAKMGFAPVEAFDFDPVAVRCATKNCRSNRVTARVRVTRRDLTRLPLESRRKYDLICANLVAPLLLAERARILGRLASGGIVVLAGILAREFGAVEAAWAAAGFKLLRSRTAKEWRSGTFQRV